MDPSWGKDWGPDMAHFLEREGIEVKGMPEHDFVNYTVKGSAVEVTPQ